MKSGMAFVQNVGVSQDVTDIYSNYKDASMTSVFLIGPVAAAGWTIYNLQMKISSGIIFLQTVQEAS